MSHTLPICFGLFLSTRGHFGRHGDWRLTLDHWDKQIPLSMFNLVAHIKVSDGGEALGSEMEHELHNRGFHVIHAEGNWSRGLSMGAAYLSDQVRVSRDPVTHRTPYFLLLEDDSPVRVGTVSSLESLLLQSCKLLDSNHELVTVRTIRRGDYEGGVPSLGDAEGGHAFYSPFTDFQPMLMRSLDFYRLGMILEANPEACQQVQCEALWAAILKSFSCSEHRHFVWKPDYAETVHLGVPEPAHTEARKLLSI